MKTEHIMPGVVINSEHKNIGLGMILSVTREQNSKTTSVQFVILTQTGDLYGPCNVHYATIHDQMQLVKMCSGDLPKKRKRWKPELQTSASR